MIAAYKYYKEKPRRRKILVTGAGGLIGHAIVEHLDIEYDVFPHDPPKGINAPQGLTYWAVIDCARYDTIDDQLRIAEYLTDRGGRLILFSSIYGHKVPDFYIYADTEIKATPLRYAMWKAGVEQATRYLAELLKPRDILVNCIAPGGVMDGQSKDFMEAYFQSGFAPMITCRNILPAIDYLLHADCASNGEVLTVDYGWCL